MGGGGAGRGAGLGTKLKGTEVASCSSQNLAFSIAPDTGVHSEQFIKQVLTENKLLA